MIAGAAQCFDDHQWWLLGWVRAYEATGNVSYVQRAAVIFDYIVDKGWTTSPCGGGVMWCPPRYAVRSSLLLACKASHVVVFTCVGCPAWWWLSTDFRSTTHRPCPV